MKVIDTKFEEVKIYKPKIFEDDRGFFMESYNQKTMLEHGCHLKFVQDSLSFTKSKGSVRGLHFQTGDMAQNKLVQVITGSIRDIIVDIREDSKTFKQYITLELNDENRHQVLIPKGFAHGFCTLSENCHVLYKLDQFYAPENNCGIQWNDTELAIEWGVDDPIISKQDENWKSLKDYFK